MRRQEEAERAVRKLQGYILRQKQIKVEWSKCRLGIRPTGPTNTLFVRNFPRTATTYRDLYMHFSKYGRVVDLALKVRYAFVEFSTIAEAKEVLEATKNSGLGGQLLHVEYANDRAQDTDEVGHDRRSRSPRRERGSPDYGFPKF